MATKKYDEDFKQMIVELYENKKSVCGLSILFWTIFIRTLFYIQLVLNNLKNYVF